MTSPGRLLLVPAPLDFGCEPPAPLDRALPAATLLAASKLTHWICESAKTTRAYLKRIAETHPLPVPLQQMEIAELPREVHKKGDHFGGFDAKPMLRAAIEGHDVGLVSEAGMPAVADPGSSVVRAAHELGLVVVALAGPSSLLLALAASGLNGQNFAFVGYLPQEPAARTQRIRELEALALRTKQTQLFIETPYRNESLWGALLQALQPSTRLAVSSGLTLDAAMSRSDSAAHWRAKACPLSNTKPAVFAIGA
ncbi:SAM-dependent methyltransferase [Ramlibacter sp.]|uniref:SAM-dependent methyltransferase n=1 Tax=Ramlibacter sp. TaxID=1917967 RepID=UPI003D09FB95